MYISKITQRSGHLQAYNIISPATLYTLAILQKERSQLKITRCTFWNIDARENKKRREVNTNTNIQLQV